MKHTRARRSVLSLGLVLLAACSEQDLPSALNSNEANPVNLGSAVAVNCLANVRQRTVSCASPEATLARGAQGLLVGGQGVWVQLVSSGIQLVADSFLVDVTVQNLIPQTMGTT